MNRPSTRLMAIALGALVLLLAAVPAAAADAISEIIAMLEGGLSEELVIDWLEAGEEILERPSAERLLELKAAGASEELLRELLRRSHPSVAAEPPAAGEAPDGADRADPAAIRQPALPKAVSAGRNEAVAAVERPEAVSEVGTVGPGSSVRFRLLYAPRFEEDEESWDLLAYLDGRPLTYVPPTSELLGLTGGKTLEVEMQLAPGRHTVRVLRERHARRRRGWRHAARAADPAFAFELAAGVAATVDIEFRQAWGDLTDPLTFRFTQGELVADMEQVGGDPEHWPELCEEAEQEPAGADCVGWASLWPGDAVPARSEVLEALELFEFRPVPR